MSCDYDGAIDVRVEMPRATWHPLAAAEYGGLPAFLRVADDLSDVPTAGGGSLDVAPESAGGPAWSDPDFLIEMRAAHGRMRASERSMQGLEALAQGAGCVICGQQPGVAGGPLYTWWKIAGAIALAHDFERRLGRPVVPVYWCGSDDSDFDEVRRAYHATAGLAPERLELPGRLWSAGQMVGELSAHEVDALEAPIRTAPTPALATVRDWGESFGAQMLKDFGQSGLVVVDARSPVLLRRGRDLFQRGLEDRETIRELLIARGHRLIADGWPGSLSTRTMESPVFRERGGRRERVDGATAESIAPDDRLMPSVLLRPLWQDRELCPLAVVLGPGELAYHAQLEPLYPHFEIVPPRTVTRPHLTLSPQRSGTEWTSEELRALACSRDEAQTVLLDRAIDPLTRRRLEELECELDRLRRRFRFPTSEGLGDAMDRFHRRSEREFVRLRRRVARRSSPSIAADLSWLWPAGLPQERALCTQSLQAMGWCGDDVVAAIEEDYVRAVARGRVFCTMMEPDTKARQGS